MLAVVTDSSSGLSAPDLVAVEARRSMLDTQAPPAPLELPPSASQAAALERPTPSPAGYDQLLTGATA